jgi:dTDP-4-amino-4,6-dideoxygalactose transaminase
MSVDVPMADLNQEIAEIRPQIDAAIKRVIDSSYFIGGPEVEAFEKEAAAYLGCKHAIGCNSGTDALLLALRAAGIGPGDEVITTPFSFFATAEPVSLLGAKPVFVEIDPSTYNICPDSVAKAITAKTKAIIPVHLYGLAADMESIMSIASKHNLLVFEDTAQAFGAEFGGQKVGTIGQAGSYSFFPSKTLGGFGDGGMVSTDDDKMAEEIRKLRSHGALVKYQNEILGYNSRLDAIQAAVLRIKLSRIDEQNAARQKVAGRYNQALSGISGLTTPRLSEKGHVFHQYTLRLDGNRRDKLREALGSAGIASMIYYPTPIHHLPIYKGDNSPDLPQVERATNEVISLPIWPKMPEATQNRVVDTIKGFLVG